MKSDDELFRKVMADKFARYVGIQLLEAREGYARVELTLNNNHLNGVNMIQGGVIFTLADYAFALASNSGNCPTVALNANISYFKTPVGKIIRAEAKEISVRNRISGYQVDITDEDGSLIASFSGLGFRKQK